MKLQLPLLFGEHMVLQRDKEIRIWGTSVEDDEISVSLNSQHLKTKAVKGYWSITFKPEKTNFKTTLKIKSLLTDEEIVFNDVAIGEVWLAGGQSNMEFIMKYDVDYPTTSKSECDNYLRCYTVPQVAYKGFMETENVSSSGYWRRWDKEIERRYFSAIATYMGMMLRDKLDVPVGIISCNWGGTPASAWCAKEDLLNTKELEPILLWHQKACENTNWPVYIKASETKQPEPTREQLDFNDRFMMGEDMSEFFKNFDPSKLPPKDYDQYAPGPRACIRPAGLYENMLCKIAPYALRGFLWYQGEDDDARDWQDFYDVSMITLINSWRKLWKEELPFYQIELAPFEGIGATGAKKYNLMRHKQEEASNSLKDVYDVCILDAGERFNIHPRRKKMVGERLGHIVMKHTYGDNSLMADCPRIKDVVRKDNIEISFTNSDGGLVLKDNYKDNFRVTYNDELISYEVFIENDKLIIKTDLSKEKIIIEYCESNYCEASLFNVEGNPVFGFTCEV